MWDTLTDWLWRRNWRLWKVNDTRIPQRWKRTLRRVLELNMGDIIIWAMYERLVGSFDSSILPKVLWRFSSRVLQDGVRVLLQDLSAQTSANAKMEVRNSVKSDGDMATWCDMMRHGQTLFTVSNTGDVSSLRVSRFQIVDCVVDSLTTNLNVS
jgi:hypothetical protein